MAGIHPQQCKEVKMLIDEEKQQLIQESIKKSNQLSYKQVFKAIIISIIAYIVECEMISFGLKSIATCPTDVTLYRYRILGAGIMIAAGCLCFIYIIYSFFQWLLSEPEVVILDPIINYCTKKDEPTSMVWYKRKRFIQSVVFICIIIILLAMFEIGHLFCIIYQSIQDKPRWSRPVVYFSASVVSFGLWSFIIVLSFITIVEYFILE